MVTMDLGDDGGLTLVEMLIAMSLLLVALTMFGSVLFAVQKAGSRGDQLSRAGDAAYSALAEMDRQLRSGYIASETAVAGAIDTVRIYTEAYTPLGSSVAVPRCVVWSVVDMGGGRQGMYTAWWTPSKDVALSPTYSGGVFSAPATAYSGVRLVAEELVSADEFTFRRLPGATGNSVGERLSVTLRLREATDPALSSSPSPGSPSATSTPWVNEISTTISPRNFPRAFASADSATLNTAERSTLCG